MLTEPIIATLEETGRQIMGLPKEAISQFKKADGSPVTSVDFLSEKNILAALSAIDPTTPVISEESALPTLQARSKWKSFWLLDPLDATKNFIKGGTEYVISLGLIENGKPVQGFLHHPPSSTTYYATDGKAYKKQKLKRQLLPKRNTLPLESSPKIVGSISTPKEELQIFLNGLKIKYPETSYHKVSSALKFGLMAEGLYDIYPRYNRTMEWDTAAGHAILEAVGMQFLNLEDNSPILYNKPNLENPNFISGIWPL